MKHNHTFTQPEETLDGCYLCASCDMPRPGPLAFCPDCECVTTSYLWDEAPGSVSGSALHRLEAETLESCGRINLSGAAFYGSVFGG